MDIVETYDMAKGGLPRFALFKEGIFEVRTPRHFPRATFSPCHFLCAIEEIFLCKSFLRSTQFPSRRNSGN